MKPLRPFSRRGARAPLLCLAAGALLTVAACAPTRPPAAPQVTPINATIKLGRIADKRFLTRVDVEQARAYPGYGVGVGAASGGGWGGGGVGVGFAFDLTRLLNRQPAQQIDIFEYRVNATDGTTVTVNGPAAPGLEPGNCVRVIYPDGGREPALTPSNEC